MSKQELHPRTAVLNKDQKNQAKKLRMDALHWLAQRFPLAFDNKIRIRPLKLGIITDILEHAEEARDLGISKAKLREAVVIFTRRLDYLTSLKARDMRIDLFGNEAGEVNAEDAEHAAAKIKKKIEKSARNARQLSTSKTHTSPGHHTAHKTTPSSVHDVFPVYPARPNMNQNQTSLSSTKTTSVVVRHKVAKQYDPGAVARLKEKLGLSRQAEALHETAE